MTAFVNEHWGTGLGSNLFCTGRPIAPSIYYEHKRREREPERRPARFRRAA